MLSRAQIALYTILAVGIFAGLVLEAPMWLIVGLAAAVGIADYLFDRGQPRRAPDAPAKWPWQRPAFWLVLTLFAVLATVLIGTGSSPGMTAFVCGIGLAFYGYSVAREIEFKYRQRKGTLGRSPGVEEWTLLAVSVAFCAIAVLIMLSTQWRTAVIVLAFFGSCALIFGSNIRRKLRERKWEHATVRVAGGVNIYMDAPRMGFIALGCFIVGATIYFVGTDAPMFMRLIGAFVALVGVGLAIAIAMGFYRRQYLRFEPDGVVLGQPGYSFRVDWDNIAHVVAFEYASNPMVGMMLHDPGAVSVDPPASLPKYEKLIRSNRATMNVDVFLAARLYGIDGPALANALQRYAMDREARAELVQHSRITQTAR
jgi:hypothetical protein